MPYKVFLVEDEIVTREGIRDNVDWKAEGFEFSGEATDGETALVLLKTIKPDILITDIKMPFMDGLQLGKLVHEQLPFIKIIILSGHDEFEYAKEAIKIGATEYLLKPITVQDMRNVLQKLAQQLDQEKKKQEELRKMQLQLEQNRLMLRENLLLKMITGTIDSSAAIDEGQQLGMDLVARCFLIVILKFESEDRSAKFEFNGYRNIQNILFNTLGNNPDYFLLKKGWEEFVILIRGNIPQYLEEERDLLLGRIQKEVLSSGFHLSIGIGKQKNRIGDIYQSFIEAFAEIQKATEKGKESPNQVIAEAELLKINRSAIETYLNCGLKEEFDEFFNTYIRPLGSAAERSNLIKNYILMDTVLVIAKVLNGLEGSIDKVIPDMGAIETTISGIRSIDQLKEEMRKMIISTLDFRDGQTRGQHTKVITEAKAFIESNFGDPELSLVRVASHVNLSPSHFSVVFSQETCQTFKEYLTTTRINKAKILLRTSQQSSNDISYLVGFNDAHYFSYVFKKHTGISPSEFRSQAQMS